jgi:DNA/RNA-binding domain of Phe-tRNA-synthetase-like protein
MILAVALGPRPTREPATSLAAPSFLIASPNPSTRPAWILASERHVTRDIQSVVAAELTSIVHPASFGLSGVIVRRATSELEAELHAAAERARIGGVVPPEVTASVRAMYKAVGLDPTKVRPSSEALLRRVRRGEPLPRINTAVDVVNWCAMESGLPFGLYDADRIEGAATLRLGWSGESYAGIRKDAVNVAGRLTVADATGPFGNPTSDSARTMVTTETTSLWVLIFAPAAVARTSVDAACTAARERLRRYCGQ